MSNIDEKELVRIRGALAKQEVNEKNILAIKDFAVMTREEFRQMQAEFRDMKNTIDMQRLELNQLKNQVSSMQIRLYSGGSTSGDND